MPLISRDLQTRFRERRRGESGGAFFERKSEGAPGGDGQHRILHHVHARHRQLRAAAMRAFQNGELGSASRSAECRRRAPIRFRFRPE